MVTTQPARTVGPWERKRFRTSLEIERAGLELLRDRGVQNVTVEQVATAAGISTRTYFRYFRNVPDLLTAVPIREVDRNVRQVMARPPDEGVIDAFRAVFEQRDRGEMDYYEDAGLEQETLALWSEIVRQEPDTVAAQSHALAVMANRYEELVIARMLLQGRKDDDSAGLLASALAGVIWFVFLRWVNEGRVGSLSSKLKRAFERLHHLMQP